MYCNHARYSMCLSSCFASIDDIIPQHKHIIITVDVGTRKIMRYSSNYQEVYKYLKKKVSTTCYRGSDCMTLYIIHLLNIMLCIY